MTPRSLLIACLITVGCDSSPTDFVEGHPALRRGAAEASVAPPDLVEARASLLAADQELARRAAGTNVVEGIVATLADDARFIAPVGIIEGRENVRSYLASIPINSVASWTWAPVRVDVSSDATQGYTYGYTELRIPGGPTLPGKYVAYWGHEADGSWRISAYKRVPRPQGDVSLQPPAGYETPDYRHYRTFPHSDPALLLEEIRQRDMDFSAVSATSGAAAAFGQFIAPDGAALGGAVEIAYGAEAAMASYAPFGPGQLVWRPLVGEVAATGDLGFTMGEAEVRTLLPDGSLSAPRVVWYLTVWKRQRDGEWLFAIDG